MIPFLSLMIQTIRWTVSKTRSELQKGRVVKCLEFRFPSVTCWHTCFYGHTHGSWQERVGNLPAIILHQNQKTGLHIHPSHSMNGHNAHFQHALNTLYHLFHNYYMSYILYPCKGKETSLKRVNDLPIHGHRTSQAQDLSAFLLIWIAADLYHVLLTWCHSPTQWEAPES